MSPLAPSPTVLRYTFVAVLLGLSLVASLV